MPFLTDLLGKIYYAIGVNWERMGNVRFAVVYKPGDGDWERGMAQERSKQLAAEWSKAMESTRNGAVRDFVAVGDVEIKVIGADNQILDSSVPIRQILEQLVSKTGIPPFMLGLSWSSTERMSTQQADLLTTEMTAIRRSLTPRLNASARCGCGCTAMAAISRSSGMTSICRICWKKRKPPGTASKPESSLWKTTPRKGVTKLECKKRTRQRHAPQRFQ